MKFLYTFTILLSSFVLCEGLFFKNPLPLELLKNFDLNLLASLQHEDLQYSNREVCINNVTMEPEAYMNTLEILQNRGYPAEEHIVQTEDGYLLGIHRIPAPGKPPVLLQHGMESNSADWVINFGNQSLGYMFWDVGYDVWIGNYRGNTYSRKHVTLDPDVDQAEFWNFSWQEMGNYDLPATIDYILNKTGYQNLTYVGHSMGTTGFFVLASNRTEYNKKIKVMVALAPAATFNSMAPNDTTAIVASHVNAIESLLNALGYYEFLPHSNLTMFLASTACSLPEPETCANVIYTIGGPIPDPDQLNKTRLPVYVAHTPAGCSTRCLYHYAQLINYAPNFQAYDFGAIKNMQIYGQDLPPLYNLTQVSAPVAIFWGANDGAALPEDVALLSQTLPNVIYNYRIDYDLWNHLDFIIGIEAERLQNKILIDFLATLP